MPDRYEALWAALLGATPGPWWKDAGYGDLTVGVGAPLHVTEVDAAYIAAADPTTVLALLEERDAWRALGREQIDACPVPEGEGCDFCTRIAALLEES